MAGIRATLSEVLTPEAYPGMIARAAEWTAGVQAAIEEFGAPWQVTQLGARAEYSFRAIAPRDGAEAAAADDFALQQYLHLHAAESRHPDDPVPQHGAHVAGDDKRRRGAPHRRVPRGGRSLYP